MELIEPDSEAPMNKEAKISSANELRARFVGNQIGSFKYCLEKIAGKCKLRGTLVKAPINATKSLKKGTAFATMNAVTARIKVNNIHLCFGFS